jgi:hypothetical protein
LFPKPKPSLSYQVACLSGNTAPILEAVCSNLGP